MESCGCRTLRNLCKMQTYFISLVFISASLIFTSTYAKSSNLEDGLSESGVSQRRNESEGTGNSTFSRRHGLLGISTLPVVNPMYFSTPPGLYHTAMGTNLPNVFQSGTPPIQQPSLKGHTSVDEGDDKVPSEKGESKTSSSPAEKVKKIRRNKNKVKDNDDTPALTDKVEAVESKTVSEEGEERGCPACVSGTCDPTLDPATNISGIPVIQIIIAAAVGAFWAGIFIFFLVNFIEHDKDSGGGYGYEAPVSSYGTPVSPAYGTPQPDYGTPSTSYSTYNTNRISNNRYGRSSQGSFSFNELSSWVWTAVDKLATLYDDQ